MTAKEEARKQKAKMWKYAQSIHTQDQLNKILLEMKSPHARGVCYELIKPLLSFNATYPEHVARYDATLHT
jgi:hypothetical protein